ncbi:MAG: hypothetical protein Q4D13_07110 [Erysipelotrichaceae bacterium]|nr:hypothetical protein [Erysipelotrichaceae bacterium]
MKKIVHTNQKLRTMRLHARSTLKKAGTLEFKPVTSAKWTDISRGWDGRVLVQIEHDDVKNCTPEMICWWFHHLSETTTWNGKDFSGPEVTFNHLWHHRDHEYVIPLTNAADGTINHGFLEGCDSKIQERFNEYHFHVDTVMHTTKLDASEFTFDIMFAGLKAGHITHLYEAVDGGSSFYAETQIGFDFPVLGWLFNWLILPFIYNKKTAEHWVRHNIEETGRTEDILPILYRNYVDKKAGDN